MSLTPEAIDACLPQTQCTRCGYPRCRVYSQAIAAGAADFNQCPPGGEATLDALAQLLNTHPKPLNPAFGAQSARQRASINEPACIGCRKCIDVCPVDAIVGARQLMHSVLDAECNGCALCLPACPVDCITLLPYTSRPASDSLWPDYAQAEVDRWRTRTQARRARLLKLAKAPATLETPDQARARRRSEIRAAVARVRTKKIAPPRGRA